MANIGLTHLPPEVCTAQTRGHFLLNDNKITELHHMFFNIRIGGDLYLNGNKLRYLPDSFGHIMVGRDLHLQDNKLRSLCPQFYNVTCGRDLHLYNNNFRELPDPDAFPNVAGRVFVTLQDLHKAVAVIKDVEPEAPLPEQEDFDQVLEEEFGDLSFEQLVQQMKAGDDGQDLVFEKAVEGEKGEGGRNINMSQAEAAKRKRSRGGKKNKKKR
eukprot:TRINITY_DN2987_c0_g1_i2.p1 TRINITY_DN2987_c0_g1~~TRINITY_DN2987_c0_g1_i2.p1  ORF type:complete len:213 (-),score=52.28 TRINITY_DN2987_c0_g1_i2:225-863(-)